jgi:hypothetical protein
MTPTITPATLVIGRDERGNEFAFTKSITGEWLDIWRACIVAKSYMTSFVFQNVTTVRFGSEKMSREQWLASGSPLELTDEQLAELHEMNNPLTLDCLKALSVEERTDMAYGQHDLGTQHTVSGDETLEFGGPQWFNSIEIIF